jgi:hypothetical protein
VKAGKDMMVAATRLVTDGNRRKKLLGVYITKKNLFTAERTDVVSEGVYDRCLSRRILLPPIQLRMPSGPSHSGI